MRVVIVGGVAGGMSAATRLRRLKEDVEIIVLEKGHYVSFANCGLPYYIGGEISKHSDLIVQTPERLRSRFDLDIRINNEVIHIDADKKVVRVRNDKESYDLAYDALVLSPGAKPVDLPLKNIKELKHVFQVRSIEDIDKIDAYLSLDKVKKALVVGAGFIGLEMVENLKLRGLDVVLVERENQMLPPIDIEMAAYVEKELIKQGIKIVKGASVVSIDEEKGVQLDDGQIFDADIIITSIGVKADSGFVESSGIQLNEKSGILVDENYETNKKGVYAVGDAIVVKHWISKEDVMIALASPANRQGRQVADVIAGLKRRNRGTLGTSIVRVFQQSVASTGLNEKQLRRMEKDYGVIHVKGNDHASYFPDATPILLKLLFDKETGSIYGAQAIGEKGVDKRIDVLSTAIKGNLSIFDLPELELSYAPPFGSAKDVVNMAGYAAMNIAEGLSDNVQWYDIEQARKDGVQLVDVRTKEEYESEHIKGFINIDLNDIRNHLDEIRKDVPVIVSCLSGTRSYAAERILKHEGFNVRNLDGAYTLYSTVCPKDIVK